MKSASKYLGRKIVAASFMDNHVRLLFDGGVSIKIEDLGQSCCENRYMTSDDNVGDLVGHSLVSIDTKEADSPEVECGCHDIVFLEIQAGHETFTVSTHNEHNGYYGGFDLSIKELKS